MKKIEILVLGKNPKILATLLRLINANDTWHGEGTMDEEIAIEKCQQRPYDILMLGAGISAEVEKKLRAVIGRLYPDMKIIQHFGGGSGLLLAQIEQALAVKQRSNFSIVDNPFA